MNHRPLSDSRIAVLGAGNGGQAIAGYLASIGIEVRLFNRKAAHIEALLSSKEIELFGMRSCISTLTMVTTDIGKAIAGAGILMVTTTADAHRDLAVQLAPYLQDGQLVVLNPGRTGGALEFRHALASVGFSNRIFVAEAQSLVYACRIETPGRVKIIGEKSNVPVAALPRTDTSAVLARLRILYDCMTPAEHVLRTSFENIGAVFHPAVVLFNAAAIERGKEFYFYQDMTPTIADILMNIDEERLSLGRAYGLDLVPISEWIGRAYPGSKGNSLCQLMRNNPAYSDIRAPRQLNSRLLFEDIPTGLVPFIMFAAAAGMDLPLISCLIRLGSLLLRRDFVADGRTLDRLGLAGLSPTEILAAI